MQKSVRELTTGEPGMSAFELCIEWPVYLETKAWLERRLRDLQGTVSPQEFERQFDRTMGGG